jgi:hypothetical protein
VPRTCRFCGASYGQENLDDPAPGVCVSCFEQRSDGLMRQIDRLRPMFIGNPDTFVRW